MGNVIAVCISPEKGTPKQDVGSAVFLEDWGLEQDAHAGKWHRQVSLVSYEKFQAFICCDQLQSFTMGSACLC